MKAGLRASRTLFEKAWNGGMASPASWHDRTPSGRVISRFSKDIAQLDDKVDGYLGAILDERTRRGWNIWSHRLYVPMALFGVRAAAGVHCKLTSMALLIQYLATAFYRKSSREIKRVESLVRSHVYSSFAEQVSLAYCQAYPARRPGRDQSIQLSAAFRNGSAIRSGPAAGEWRKERANDRTLRLWEVL